MNKNWVIINEYSSFRKSIKYLWLDQVTSEDYQGYYERMYGNR